jgi:hypothetical protein
MSNVRSDTPVITRGDNIKPTAKKANIQLLAAKRFEDSKYKDGNVFVVENVSKFTTDLSSGSIVVESNAPDAYTALEDIYSIKARNLAIAYAAQKGVADPRINGNLHTQMALNSKGEYLENVKDKEGNPLPPSHPDMQPTSYQVTIPITKKLI